MSTFQGRDKYPGYSELVARQTNLTERFASEIIPRRMLTDEEIYGSLVSGFRFQMGIHAQRNSDSILTLEQKEKHFEQVMIGIGESVNRPIVEVQLVDEVPGDVLPEELQHPFETQNEESGIEYPPNVISIFRNIRPADCPKPEEQFEDVG